MVNFKHGRLLRHGRTPLEQWVASEKASNIKITNGQITKFQIVSAKKTKLAKIFRSIFPLNFLSFHMPRSMWKWYWYFVKAQTYKHLHKKSSWRWHGIARRKSNIKNKNIDANNISARLPATHPAFCRTTSPSTSTTSCFIAAKEAS